MFNKSLLLGIFILCLFITKVNSDELGYITIAENPIVDGKEVYLGDIASIKTSDGLESDMINKVHLCQSAKPGSSVKLNIGYIKSRTKQQGVSPDLFVWDSPDNITIQTKSKVISSQEVQIYAENFIKDMVKKIDATINIQPSNEIKPIVLPYGEVNVKVESLSRYSINGNFSLRFTFSVDGREYEKRLIPFNLVVMKEVIVATNQIEMNKIITEDDLTLSSQDIGLSLDVFLEKDKLVGKCAKKMISKGAFITSDMVEQPAIIKQGDPITIVAESSSLRISVQGKAMENGKNGQVIRVINTSSLKELLAQVIDNKTVKITF